MKKMNSKSYNDLREYIDHVPVIDTHEHYIRGTKPYKINNILEFAVATYYISDCQSVSCDIEDQVTTAITNNNLPFDKRYEIFEKAYKKSNKTAYAASVHRGLKECWGIDNLSKESLIALEHKIKDRDESFYEDIMKKYNIKAKILNVCDDNRFKAIVEGKADDYSTYCRHAFPLFSYHTINNIGSIRRMNEYIGRNIITLDDYIEAFNVFFNKSLELGIVCVKDQSAYVRNIEFKNVTKHEAEKVFNKIILNPIDVVGPDEAKVLNDYLFHYFMRLAQKHKLPVQLHTGHMAGIRNEISKTNAVHLNKLIQLYSDVKFDLFHGNWPYMDEYLFLGKNYPNVSLDLCWVQGIDPIYSIELMKRAIVTMPQSKIMAFGGDTDYIEQTIGFLSIARDNVAYALSDMVDSSWLSMNEAREIACDWFFNNPNELFDLGFDRINI